MTGQVEQSSFDDSSHPLNELCDKPFVCEMCQRTFKSAKGVTTHRSAKNSSCKLGKSPPRSTEETSSFSDKENSSGGVLASCSAPHLVRNVLEDSIILIEDTPPARAEVRRSIRAKN